MFLFGFHHIKKKQKNKELAYQRKKIFFRHTICVIYFMLPKYFINRPKIKSQLT